MQEPLYYLPSSHSHYCHRIGNAGLLSGEFLSDNCSQQSSYVHLWKAVTMSMLFATTTGQTIGGIIVLRTFSARDWTENLRMSREMFKYLCQELLLTLQQKNTECPLWCHATPTKYCTISHLFGIAHSTACEIMQCNCEQTVEYVHNILNWRPVGWCYWWIYNEVGGFQNAQEPQMAAIYLQQLHCIIRYGILVVLLLST